MKGSRRAGVEVVVVMMMMWSISYGDGASEGRCGGGGGDCGGHGDGSDAAGER